MILLSYLAWFSHSRVYYFRLSCVAHVRCQRSMFRIFESDTDERDKFHANQLCACDFDAVIIFQYFVVECEMICCSLYYCYDFRYRQKHSCNLILLFQIVMGFGWVNASMRAHIRNEFNIFWFGVVFNLTKYTPKLEQRRTNEKKVYLIGSSLSSL